MPPEVAVTVTPEATPAPAPAVVAAPAQVPEEVLRQLMDLGQRLTETEQRLQQAQMDMVEQYQLNWMRESINELRTQVEACMVKVAELAGEEEEEEEEEPAAEQTEVPVPVVQQQQQQQQLPPQTESPMVRFLKAIL